MTDVERWWLRIHAANRDMESRYHRSDQHYVDFEDLDGADARADLQAFNDEARAADEAVRDMTLDDQVPSHGHHPERRRHIRWTYLHMIEEYARHNGHADLLRERIDGVTGD